jgi:hypothetical protein
VASNRWFSSSVCVLLSKLMKRKVSNLSLIWIKETLIKYGSKLLYLFNRVRNRQPFFILNSYLGSVIRSILQFQLERFSSLEVLSLHTDARFFIRMHFGHWWFFLVQQFRWNTVQHSWQMAATESKGKITSSSSHSSHTKPLPWHNCNKQHNSYSLRLLLQ